MAIILFDDNAHQTLLPLTYTRPVANLRIGILTIAEKWARHLDITYSYQTQPYLQAKFPLITGTDDLYINGSVCPDEGLLEAINQLKQGEALKKGDFLISAKAAMGEEFSNIVNYDHLFIAIKYPEDIFSKNDIELRKDFKLLTKGRTSATISATNVMIGNDFFAEEGATAECSTFNTHNGPIYLGKNSSVWEGVNVRGALALCDDSQIKMGAKIYGATTIGPFSRVGGEINNAVIWGHSSKGHEGYLGNSVLGEWCNIGADTNNSNLKNNYAEVKLWDYTTTRFRKTGLQFCGLIMADHVKCGINTMFNTGTVVGVGANVFGAGFPRNFVPDFAWGGAQGFEVYTVKKMFETATLVFQRRGLEFGEIEQDMLRKVFELTEVYRNVF